MKEISITCFVLLGICVGCKGEPPDAAVHHQLLTFAGNKAIDCGRVLDKVANEKPTKCALTAMSRNSPFVVQYQKMGTDALVEEGIARDGSGRLIAISTIAWSPLYHGGPSGKIETFACNENSLHKLGDGSLVCDFQPK